MDWKFGVNKCQLLPLEWISNEILLCSTGNYIWSLMMEHDNVRKKNDIMPFGATWMELETLILSEINQKDKYHMISLITGIYYPAQMNISTEKKIMDLENKLVACPTGEVGSGRDLELGLIRHNLE